MTLTLESLVAHAIAAEGLEILSLDAEGAEVRLPGAEAVSALRFANLRRLLAALDEAEHPAAVASFTRRWTEAARRAGAPAAEQDPAANLMPRVVAPGEAPGGVGPWAEPLAGGALQLMLVFDRPESVRFVTPFDLPRWRLGLREARAAALQNLEARSQTVRDGLEAALAEARAPVTLRVETGDGYDAARLLLIQRWMGATRGALVVAPCRDLLVVVPVFGRDSLRSSLELATRAWLEAQTQVRRRPYPLSPRLFWRDERALEALEIRADERGAVAVELPGSMRDALEVAH